MILSIEITLSMLRIRNRADMPFEEIGTNESALKANRTWFDCEDLHNGAFKAHLMRR